MINIIVYIICFTVLFRIILIYVRIQILCQRSYINTFRALTVI